MRQSMSRKNVAKYARKLNLPIVGIKVRGGTGHRKDLLLEDGSISSLYPNGSIVKQSIRWTNFRRGD